MPPLPQGTYRVKAIKVMIGPSPFSPDKSVQVQFCVLDGPHRGRWLWARFKLWKKNQNAVAFEKARLASLLQAVGLLPSHPSLKDLCGIPLRVDVSIGAWDGSLFNRVSNFQRVLSRIPVQPDGRMTTGDQPDVDAQHEVTPDDLEDADEEGGYGATASKPNQARPRRHKGGST